MKTKYTDPRQKITMNVDPDKETGCWNWLLSKSPTGYGYVGHEGKSWRAHRLAWHLFRGPIPDKACVLHSCDNPACCRPTHLFLGTQGDNVRDMDTKGRRAAPSEVACHNEKHGMAKLSDFDVAYIRREYAHGDCSQYDLAARFGVCQSYISRIILGKNRSVTVTERVEK